MGDEVLPIAMVWHWRCPGAESENQLHTFFPPPRLPRFLERGGTSVMALCTHHVLTSSTLSFWGAYLDERQPTGGKTILHASFFDAHGRGMVPYTEWIVRGDHDVTGTEP